MKMTTLLLMVSLAGISSSAHAANSPRHCVGKDKKEIRLTVVSGKPLAVQCMAAGGTWVGTPTKRIKLK